MKYEDFVKELGYSGWDAAQARQIIKNSPYKHNYMEDRFGNATIKGDIEEIKAYVKENLVPHEEEPNNEEIAFHKQNDILKDEIKKLKDSLPNGSDYFEYKTVIIKDSEFLGTVDAELIENTLNKYALEGWRLKAAVTIVRHIKRVFKHKIICGSLIA